MRRKPIYLLFTAVALFTQLSAHASVKNWNNSSGGSWFVASNWSPAAVPLTTDTVNITLAGTYTVAIDSHNVQIKRLVLGGSSGVQTLQFSMSANLLTLTANSDINANGRLNIGRGQLDIGVSTIDLTNSGGLTIDSAGTLSLGTGSELINQSGGTVSLIDTVNITGIPMGGGFSYRITNHGTVTKTGSGKLRLYCAFIVTATGSFTLQNGSMDVWDLETYGLVNLYSGTTTTTRDNTGNGWFWIYTNGVVDVQGTANVNGSVAIGNEGELKHTSVGASTVSCGYFSEQSNGELRALTGKFSFTGSSNYMSCQIAIGPEAELVVFNGNFSEAAITSTVADSGTLTLIGNDQTMFTGTFSFTGNMRVLSSNVSLNPSAAISIHTFYIEAGASFTCDTTVYVEIVNMNGGTTNSQMVVNDQYNWTAGNYSGTDATSVTIDPGIQLTISGPAAKELDARDMFVDGSADLSGSGVFSLSNGAAFVVNTAGTLAIGDSISIYGPTDSLINHGSISISSPLDTSKLNIYIWNIPSGRAPGVIDILEGTVQVEGEIKNNGEIKVESPATVLLENQCTNANTFELSNGSTCNVYDTLINTSTGVINMVGNISIGGNGVFINGGTVNKSGNEMRTSARASIEIPLENCVDTGFVDVIADSLVLLNGGTNRGTINIRSGAVLSIRGTFVNEAEGTIQGSGLLDISQATFINSGTISPGASPGQLSVTGNLNSPGTINIEVAGRNPGSEYDLLWLNGDKVGSGGTIHLSRLNGFIPSMTDTFACILFNACNSPFEAVTGTAIGNGKYMELAYRPTNIVQFVCDGVSAISVSVTSLSDTVRCNDQDTLEFTICNQGHCPLEWTSSFVQFTPSGSELTWLQVLAGGDGLLTRGNCHNVKITFNASDLQAGTYTGQIAINSNDPENTATIIPVSLNVPSNYDVGGGLMHFRDVYAAVVDLQTHGILEPTVFNVYPGTYDVIPYLTPVGGASALNTITFRNAGSASDPPVLQDLTLGLDGADYFTFDNINVVGGILLTNNADHNTFRNLTVTGFGLFSSAINGIEINGLNNDNNLIDSVTISNAYTAIKLGGGTPAVLCQNNEVKNCAIPNCVIGVNISRQSGSVHDNDIQPGYDGLGNSTVTGVMLSAQQAGDTARIYNNKIHNFRGTGAGAGISGAVSMTGLYKVYNNIIYNWQNNTTFGIYGFRANSGARVDFAFNSIRINSIIGSPSVITAININHASTVVSAYNNILQIDEPTKPCWSIYNPAGTLTCDYNCFYGTGSVYYAGRKDTVNCTSLASWRIKTGQDLHSKQGDPGFCSSSDLHIDRIQHFVDSAGVAIAGISTDIDGEARCGVPDLGADEYIAINDRVDDLVIKLNRTANGVDLNWSAVPGANSYRIYMTDANDYLEEPHILLTTTGNTTYTHSGILLQGSVIQLRYFVVVSSALP